MRGEEVPACQGLELGVILPLQKLVYLMLQGQLQDKLGGCEQQDSEPAFLRCLKAHAILEESMTSFDVPEHEEPEVRTGLTHRVTCQKSYVVRILFG